MDYGLEGKVAIVTGGTAGVGRACVEALAAQGVRVATCARGIDALQQTADEVSRATGTEIFAHRADVTDPGSVKEFVAATIAKFGRIDILVNNATLVNRWSSGPGEVTPTLDIPDEYWIGNFTIKVVGNALFYKEVLPHMRAQHWGRIVNMTGGAARSGGSTQGATNAAVINFTKVVADQVAADGITVNAIYPHTARGGIDIRLAEAAERQGITIEEARQRDTHFLQSEAPRGEAEDAANLMLFFTSKQAAAITGQVVSATGVPPAVYY